MPSKSDIAAMTGNLTREMNRAVEEHGPDSPQAEHAKDLVDRTLEEAHARGVTAEDYAAARRNRA